MNLRNAIPLTMAVSFAASFGALVWMHARAPSDSASEPPVARQSVGRHEVARVAPQHPPTPIPAVPPVSTPDAGTAAPGTGRQKPELPLDVRFQRVPRAKRFIAVTSSRTSEPVTIDIEIFNPATRQGSQTSVSVDPAGVKWVGAGDGVEILPGDRLTLHNAAYLDLTVEAPGA